MKRLFIYDLFKRRRFGRGLCKALIQEAKNMGYEKMRLDHLARAREDAKGGKKERS